MQFDRCIVEWPPDWKNQEDIIVAKIERFEDLQSWQKARQLANVIYDLT